MAKLPVFSLEILGHISRALILISDWILTSFACHWFSSTHVSTSISLFQGKEGKDELWWFWKLIRSNNDMAISDPRDGWMQAARVGHRVAHMLQIWASCAVCSASCLQLLVALACLYVACTKWPPACTFQLFWLHKFQHHLSWLMPLGSAGSACDWNCCLTIVPWVLVITRPRLKRYPLFPRHRLPWSSFCGFLQTPPRQLASHHFTSSHRSGSRQVNFDVDLSTHVHIDIDFIDLHAGQVMDRRLTLPKKG